MKRFVDLVLSGIGLILTSPMQIAVLLCVWLQDFHSPLYVAKRVGQGGALFSMIKIRSMTMNSDASGVDSTSADDDRITPVGRFVRAYKIDELSQLWNVLFGHMSLVGPRPNVPREVALYTDAERALLSVKPGVTDIASIVFSDEGEILQGCDDADVAYHQLIRPWKSRLGLHYVHHRSLVLDIWIIILTLVAILNKALALRYVHKLLVRLRASEQLIMVAKRQDALQPYPPPGAADIVMTRHTKGCAR
jgi:lipopolysaccharide/colanic/teichoic acid biosynthesis glycosyltransferase